MKARRRFAGLIAGCARKESRTWFTGLTAGKPAWAKGMSAVKPAWPRDLMA